ncbi:hypothetical protein [Streptomyces canus]|uniref:hypothetical protein n=1 Tax=Streptomyces canus TaxID=58343 RepID=UPI002E265D82
MSYQGDAMSSSGGSGAGAPAGNGSTDGDAAQRSNHRIQIIAAVIAAAAALCVPVVAFLLPEDGRSGATVTSDPQGSSTSTGSCKLDKLSQHWVTPDSVPQNRQYYENGSEPDVRVRISAGDNPSIEVVGQIKLAPHPGQDLLLAVWPDPNSRDTTGNRGSGQYYPHGSIEPDSTGCWNDAPHLVGYPGVRGITETYSLELVPHDQAVKVLAREGHPDGYSPQEWEALDTTTVFSFTVPTAKET